MDYQIYNAHYQCTVTDFMNELVHNNIPCHVVDRGHTMPSDITLKNKNTGAQHFIQQFLLPAGMIHNFFFDPNLKDEVSYIGPLGNLQVIDIKERLDTMPKIQLKDECICSKDKFGFAGHASYCKISNFKE